MPNKKFSDSNMPEWEQPYHNKPAIPDWKEQVMAAGLFESAPNEFETLFQETNENLLQRDVVTDRASFMKKDEAKIAQEIRSRLDRALKGYKHQIVDAYKDGGQIEAVVKMTTKASDPRTIVATFTFNVEKPQLFNMNPTAETIKANQTFSCNDQQYPINKSGFDSAFSTHGVKYADSHVIATMYQLEESYDGDDIISGIDSGYIAPLNEKVYVCEASYLNSLKTLTKTASVDRSFVTDRHIEADSDSSARLQGIEKQEIQFDSTPDSEFAYYSDASILAEIKTNFGIVGTEAEELVQSGLDHGMLMAVPGGYITEGKFSQKLIQADLADNSRLKEALDQVAGSHITSKIQGEFRHEAEPVTKAASLLITAKAKIDGKNQIQAHAIEEAAGQILIKVSTTRAVSSYEIPVDYFFCFKADGSLKGSHAVIAGKNCELDALPGFYTKLEKEALRQEAASLIHPDHHQELSPLHRNESYTKDDARAPKAAPDTDKFLSVKASLAEAVKMAADKGLLTSQDVEIFANKIESSKQVSELTQIEREFKILTDAWSI